MPSPKDLTADEIVHYLIDDLEQLVNNVKKYIDTVTAGNDKVTENMLIGIIASYEKMI